MSGKIWRWLVEGLSRVPILGGPIKRRAWYPYRHQWLLLASSRENYTFTQFVRLPHQLDALAGPVVDFLRPKGSVNPLRVVVFGCSNGAEPYSMASTLTSRRPDVSFEIFAADIDRDVIEKAVAGRYTREELAKNQFVDPSFIAATFVANDDVFEVRPEIRQHTRFQIADVLDAGLVAAIEQADIVVAQNFLYHLQRRQARVAFANLCALLKPRSALFVDGMDLDIRYALSKKAGLVPLDYLIPEIHNDGMALRGGSWPWQYWGLEPLNTARKDWKQRYATIFLRDISSPAAST
jgi:chemotaxis protein methyltransferase CheR